MNCELSKAESVVLRDYYIKLEEKCTEKMKNYLREITSIKNHEDYDSDDENFEMDMILNDLEMKLRQETKNSAKFNDRLIFFYRLFHPLER